MLTFPPGTVVDATAFERAVVAVLADPAAPDSPGRARAALDRYTGTLLPDLPYADWAAEPRERLRARQLALLDLLAAAAEQAGDADEALRFLEQAIEVDRFDESRYLQAARLQLVQGRRGRALKTLRDAAGAVRQLGLEPSAEHRRLVAATRG
jgi:DNA-binding SARP family transcriptional activator